VAEQVRRDALPTSAIIVVRVLFYRPSSSFSSPELRMNQPGKGLNPSSETPRRGTHA
jgi:hypothetical protein